MPNSTSAKKRVRRDEKHTQYNAQAIRRIRSFIKKVVIQIAQNNKEEARKALRIAESELQKGVSKGIVKKNTASRKISRLSASIKKIAA